MKTVAGFDFVPCGERAWRLHARRDGELVAYVERLVSGEYEAVWVAGGHGIQVFADVEALVGAAAVLFGGEERHPSTKPAPIPHRKPLRSRHNVA